MSATARKHYDHRIRQAIVKAGDTELFPRLDIPDSTRRSWLSRGVTEVVTLNEADAACVELHARIAKLEKKVAVLAAVVRLLVTFARVSGATLAEARVPTASGKRWVLRAVARAEPAIGRDAALRILGLPPSSAACHERGRPCFPGETGLVQMRGETGVRIWHGARR